MPDRGAETTGPETTGPETTGPVTDPTPDLTPDQAPGESSGRERLVQALKRPWSRGQAVAAVLLAALGFAAVVQVRATDQDQTFVGARQADLIALINTLALATDRAEAEIAQLRRTRESLEDDADASRTATEVARREAEALGILAGTLPASGPGIRVTITGPAGAVGIDQMLNGLQELRNAGAEAIELNDAVRVVAQTALVDAPGAGLEVDGREVALPFVLEAIGDPHTLTTALDFEGGFRVEVEQVGGTVTVEELRELKVTSTRPAPEPTFAEPREEE